MSGELRELTGKAALIRELAARIQAVRVREEGKRPVYRLGIPAVDELLPGGGLPRDGVTEWLGEAGSGAWGLGIKAAAEAAGPAGKVVIVDPTRQFYPLAARPWGLDLRRTLLVHPDDEATAVWAMDEALRCRAVAVVVGITPHLDHRATRRLQLGAETGGRPCILLRPARARAEPSWAQVRWLVTPLPGASESGRVVRLDLLRCRGRMEGASLVMELRDEEGLVRLVPQLAPSAPRPQPTGTAWRSAGAV